MQVRRAGEEERAGPEYEYCRRHPPCLHIFFHFLLTVQQQNPDREEEDRWRGTEREAET